MHEVAEQLERLPELLLAHLSLTLVALLVAVVVSVPLGIVSTRFLWLERVAVATASVIQTVPALAMLAMMVPLLAALGASGIGYLPAIIGLSLYAMFPILMGTITGIREVDSSMIEAGDGVGMTSGERLRMVELPLALPVIVSGLRTSTTWCVGMATLSTPVGAPSLGNYIFAGLQTRNYTALLVGCIAAALLAQVLDLFVRSMEVGLRERSPRRLRFGAAGVGGCYLLAAGVGLSALVGASAVRPLRVGAKAFTESYVLSEILSQYTRAETAREVETVPSLGSTVAFDALVESEIDLYVDYSGTIWTTIMGRGDVPEDRRTVMSEMRTFLEEEYGVVVVAALGFENAYCLAMKRRVAEELSITRISDLGVVATSLSIGGDFEFFDRQEWVNIEARYGVEFARERPMDPSLMYEAIVTGAVDVVSAYSTDGRIDAYDLLVLDDDRGAIPPYDAVILASPRLVREDPGVVEALRRLEGSIDADAMRAMNRSVDADSRTPAEVARGHLAARPF